MILVTYSCVKYTIVVLVNKFQLTIYKFATSAYILVNNLRDIILFKDLTSSFDVHETNYEISDIKSHFRKSQVAVIIFDAGSDLTSLMY